MQTYKTIDDILKQKPSSVTPDYGKYADYFAPKKTSTTKPVRGPTPPEKLIVPLEEPKSEKKTNVFTAVGNSLLSSIINIARQTTTVAPELRSMDIDKNQKQLEGIVDKLSPYLKRSAKRTTPIEGAISEPVVRGIQESHDKTYEFLSEQERAAQERANLENASGFTRLMGNVAGSLPLSLATRMPIAGWALMYNTTFKNSLEESLAKNPNATADDKNMIVLKATGDAALELGTEMIFPLFGKTFSVAKKAIPGSLVNATRGIVNAFKGTAKATARTALAETAEAAAKRLGLTYVKPTIRNITKTILQQSGEEAIEEGLNYFGGAVLAKITTDKDRSLFKTRDGQEALFTWSGLFEASLTGAVSGGLITTARATPASISYYRNKNIFENLKTQMAETNSKTMEESGQEDADALLNAVDIDMQEPINQEFVSEQVLDVIQKNADTSQIPQEVFDEMTPQQTSAFLESNPDYVADENGKPISIDQLRQTVAQGSTTAATPQGIQTPTQTVAQGSTTATTVQDMQTPARTVRTPTVGSAAPRVVSPNVGVSAPTTIRTRVKPNQYENITPVLVSANTVVPSHDAFGNPNEGYNTEYQPRGRERSASVGQMQQIVNETDYGLLSETGNVASGITTFNPDDSNVMSGNGRVAAMQEIYRRGGQPAERLRTEMLSLAESLGIDTTNAPANPIVSGVIPEGVDPVQFARDSNPEEGLAYSPAENAKNDARKITTKMLSEYADVDLGQTANQSFVSDFMSQFTPEERAAFQDKDGKLSQAGKQRIENAIFYKAFPNDALINLISESTDSHIKNTTNALRSVAGLVLKTKDMIANGEAYELDISNLIMASMERYIAMSNMPKPNGFESAIDAYFRQVPMEVVEMTPAEEGMVKLFYGFRSSRLQLAGWLNDYYNEIPMFGNPKEPSLMGMSTEPNSDAVLDRALLKAFGGEKFKYGLAKEEAQQSNEISITDFMGGGQQAEQALGGFADPVEEAAREIQSKQTEVKSDSKITAKVEETPRKKTTAEPAVKAAHQLTYNEYVKTHPRTERQQTSLAAITDAVDSIGRSRLEDNGIIKADETVEQMAERYASEYKIKDINKKELWGSDSNVESFRKALLGYMRGRRAGFLEKGELHPRSQHEEFIRSAIKSGKSIPDNVKAEYPKLFEAETKSPTAQQSQKEIDLSKAEIISSKTSMGNIYKIGNKIYKPTSRKGGKTTREAEIYKLFKGSEVIGNAEIVNINGRDYLEMPAYDYVVSIDDVNKSDRDKFVTPILDNIDRILLSVQEITNAGYDYGDPLQFGFDIKSGNMYLIDFSNAEKYNKQDDLTRDTLRDNYDRIERFLKEFGIEKQAKIISDAIEIKEKIEYLKDADADDVKSRFADAILGDYNNLVREMVESRPDTEPNNVYYSTNARPVEIGNIMQSDMYDGAKYIYTDKPLTDKQVNDWELKRIYESQPEEVKAEPAEQPAQKKVNKLSGVSATQAVAEESQKQDRSGVLRIMPESMAKGINLSQEKAPRRTGTYQDTISPKTRKRIDAAKDPYQKTTLKEWFAEFKETFRQYTTRGSVPVPIEKGDLRVQFRKVRTAKNQAKMLATRIIEQVYNPVGAEKKPMLDDAIMYLDLAEDIALGRYGDRIDLPFGQTPLEVLTTARAIATEIKKPENEVVLKAMNLRKKLLKSVRSDLIKSADKVGIDLEYLNDRQEYMHHAVIQYQTEYQKDTNKKRQSKKLAYLKRKGSNKDYITDPVFADYMIIEKMVGDTYKLNLYNEIKKLDVSADLPLDEDGKYIIPDDYAEVDVSMVGMSNYNRYRRDEVIARAEQSLKNLGIKENSDEWIDVITRANHEANQKTLVVPDYIPTALELEFGKKDSAVGKYPKMLMNAWKFTRLSLPGVVWFYNVRNMFGDLDAVMMGDLRTIKYVPQAVTELYKFYYNKGNVVVSNDLADFINRTGLISGQVAQELKSLKSHRTFAMYSKDVTGKTVTAQAISKAWSALTMETSTEFREQILRYAAYKSFLDRFKNSKTGTLKYYAASIPSEIDNITDVKDKAAKMATDLLGAYDDITIAGQYASDHVIPFFRFKEIQHKRNYRMLKNSFHKSPELVLSVGEGIVGSLKVATKGSAKVTARVGLSSVIRVAKVAIGLTLFYGALDLFNHYVAGDEEDKLPESVKNVPHITIPGWLSKDDRVRYIDRLGAFGEFMDMYGIDKDIGPDIKDVIAGRMSPKDKMLEIIMSPVKDIFNSAVPFAKMAFEVMAGQQYFPDPTDPRDIRDRWEYLFNIVGLKDEYNAVFTSKPMIEGSYLKHKAANLLTKSVLEGDAALWDMYAYEEDFYRRHDISQSSVKWERDQGDKAKKAKAVYYYKQALKLGDTKAAEHYLKEYAFYGGTKTTLKQSMATMEPLYWVDKKYKDQMIEEMSEEEKETYERAKAWIKELQAIEKPNIDWIKKKPKE